MCPVRLWLPGVMSWWKASLGHLLSAGQLPPAQLFIRLLVYHQQPCLPFHSLDPLYHLGQREVGEGQQALPWVTQGHWHHSGLTEAWVNRKEAGL